MKNIILAPVSIGELIDKITILEIKKENVTGKALANVENELYSLKEIFANAKVAIDHKQVAKLRHVNQTLWRIEDKIREHEKRKDFGENFVSLARSVYKQNDQRAAIKRLINIECDSGLIEEKFYQAY